MYYICMFRIIIEIMKRNINSVYFDNMMTYHAHIVTIFPQIPTEWWQRDGKESGETDGKLESRRVKTNYECNASQYLIKLYR